jgi:nitrate reductase molybdenum cofactor assembly chaperone NarJ/NarW
MTDPPAPRHVDVHPLKLCSLLLQYPDEERLAARADLAEAAGALPSGAQRDALRSHARWFATEEPRALQRAYVETFDFSRRTCLYLTYHLFGDRRQRGMALLALKQRYAAAGYPLGDGELPDYLPVVLEFCALVPEPGLEILARYRTALELVRASLHAAESAWAPLLDAVSLPLGQLTRAQAARVRRLAAEGPPEEQVGLEPFGPPALMPSAAMP